MAYTALPAISGTGVAVYGEEKAAETFSPAGKEGSTLFRTPARIAKILSAVCTAFLAA